MSLLSKIFGSFLKKVIACPYCGQRSQVPVKSGKTLLITCPGCSEKFEIKFEGIADGLKQLKQNPFKSGAKKNKYTPFLIGILVLIVMKSCFVQAPQKQTLMPNQAAPVQHDERTPILDL